MATDTLENPWRTYMAQVYTSRKGPEPLGTVVFEEIEEKARQKLKDYRGSAGSNSTYRANKRAFEKWGIIPRMLINATGRSLSTTIFGVKHSSPLFIAPIGVQAIFNEQAELAPARAGAKLGVPLILSTAASRTIEEVAEANGDGYRWYQLYWPKTNEITLSLLARAKAAGYKALVVTLDTTTLGWRPHDLETAYLPFGHGVGIQIGKSDPVFMARHNKQPLIQEGDEKAQEDAFLGREWLGEVNSGTFKDWEDLKFLRKNWDGPIVLKGIQSVFDAELAIDAGVEGFIVSNHGGRQVDGAIGSLQALETIMKSPKIKAAQASGKLTVLFDSGIRTGSDIFKALALGAQGVLLGRPWVYAGVIAGQAGIEQVIQHTLADLDATMALAGYKKLEDIIGKADEVLARIE
ncbi:oxidoreductase [Cyathus striatus]|nr:oxidoreductase [Cyathus striatus]